MFRLTQKRCLSLSYTLNANRAGIYRRNKFGKDYKLTYDQSFEPRMMGLNKSPQSLNANNLYGEPDPHEPAVEDTMIRNFLIGTFYRLIYTDDIIIKRRLNNIDISLFVYENQPIVHKEFGPDAYRKRGVLTRKIVEPRYNYTPKLPDEVRTLSWLKGFSETILEKVTHCNVTLHLHLVSDREFVYKDMKTIKNNIQTPRFKKGDDV